MPTEAKQAAVAELREELSNSTAAIVADYRGLTVADIQAVRRALRSEGVTYRVVKNRLAKIAAQEAGREQLNELLEGPTALAMGAADEVTLARVFLDAIRPYKSVVVRGGMIGDTRVDAGSITRMAALPGREVLLAQLAGGIASPLATMASLLAAPLRNLAYALAQVAETKGQAEGATAVGPEAAAEAAPAEAEAAPDAETSAAPEATAEAETAAQADVTAEAEATTEADAATDKEAPTEAEASTEADASTETAADQPEASAEAAATSEAEAPADEGEGPADEVTAEAEATSETNEPAEAEATADEPTADVTPSGDESDSDKP